MRILYSNYLSTAATLTASNEDPISPVENIYNPRLSQSYRTLQPLTTETVTITKTCAPCYVALVDHNVSSSASVYIEASTESAFTSTGVFSTTVPWSSYTMYTYFASTSRNYWRLRIVGQSTGTSYINIGYMWLSTHIEMPGMKPDQTIKDETTARVDISFSGQAYGDSGYDFRAPSINFPYLTNTERENVRTMWRTVHNYLPVYVIIWPGSTIEEKPIYGIINQNNIEWKRTDDRTYRWTTQLTFREVF